MQHITSLPSADTLITQRVKELFYKYKQDTYKHIDRMFAILMVVQWLAGIAAAVWISPRTWVGAESQIHLHVWVSIFLGSVITFFPVALALTRPGETSTRYVIAIGQMLMGALLIHLSGGRIETHFHIFGSLAFLAFYRDWRVLVPATLVVVADHLIRGIIFPQSIFGVLAATNWRWLEHAGWVVFIDIFLVISCIRGEKEMEDTAERAAELEIGEERFRDLFDNANDLIYTHDLTGNFTSLNRAGENITGYNFEETLRMNISQMVAPNDLALAREMITRKVTDGTATAYEINIITKDGQKRTLEVSTRLIGQNGQPVGVQGIARDITERKRSEEMHRESEERFQLVSRATNDTIWDWNLTTDELWWSEGFQSMFGYEPEEVGENIESWTSRLHADDLERVGHSVHEVIDNGGQTWTGEYRFRRRDGNYAVVADRGYVVRNDKGEAVRMLGSMIGVLGTKAHFFTLRA